MRRIERQRRVFFSGAFGCLSAGCAVLVISEELEELFELSDRMVVIAGGRLSPSVPAREATIERIGQWMGGLFEKDSQADDATRETKEPAHAQA